jgi:uncharacterized protein (DUF3084 family)
MTKDKRESESKESSKRHSSKLDVDDVKNLIADALSELTLETLVNKEYDSLTKQMEEIENKLKILSETHITLENRNAAFLDQQKQMQQIAERITELEQKIISETCENIPEYSKVIKQLKKKLKEFETVDVTASLNKTKAEIEELTKTQSTHRVKMQKLGKVKMIFEC